MPIFFVLISPLRSATLYYMYMYLGPKAHFLCLKLNHSLYAINCDNYASIVARWLTPNAIAIFVHGFVTSKLDYLNSLYSSGLPVARLSCLDRVLRNGAGVIGSPHPQLHDIV